jgi:beta-lactamase regulating signal transducer with metallopeptidase domain
MTTAIAVIVDVSVVTGVALLVCRALRRTPAALRHMILAASITTAAAAPVLEATLPNVDLPVLAGASLGTSSALTSNSELASTAAIRAIETPDAPGLTWTRVLVAGWAIGFVIVMTGLLAGLARLALLTRRCRPAESLWRERAHALSTPHGLTRAVVVLECPDRPLLLTWGLFPPRILVPAGARTWTRERIDVVLTHELAHIGRRDWALQIAAQVLCAMHWFNPVVWIAARRLRAESEQACDDVVLQLGLNPVDYASHLLAVARHVVADGRTWASAPAVADPSTLERRIAAMLNVSRNRQPLTRTAAVFTLLGTLALTVPLAAVTLTERLDSTVLVSTGVNHDVRLLAPAPEPPSVVVAAPPVRRAPRAAAAAAAAAPQEPASVSGTLRDASGALLPGVQVTLASTVSDIRSSTVSDPTGSFAFRNVPPSTYALVAQLPGFATLKTELMLNGGQSLQTGSLTLQVGSLVETVTVTCQTGAAVSSRVPAVLAFYQQVAAPRLFAIAPEPPALTPAAQLGPLRIGGQIAAPRQIKKVTPVCPGSLAASGEVVMLEGTIGVDGLVKDVKTLRPRPGEQQEIAQPAIDAIRQWEYTPTRLNNVPIPVIITVTVVYARQ